MSNQEKEELKLLLEKYPENNQTIQLRHVMDKVTSELARIEATKKVRAEDVYAYITKNMPEEKFAIWDEYLTQETKTYLLEELEPSSKEDIPRSICNTVKSEIRENCAYPVPHALRHMWCEAVLRRFSGDVGWFIRSNFKHISLSMFMRYLRNKENKAIFDTAKRQVIHSLFRNHILSRGEEGHRYSGKMNTYLQRVSKSTVITSIDELDQQLARHPRYISPWDIHVQRFISLGRLN